MKHDVVSGETDGSLKGKSWTERKAKQLSECPEAQRFERDELFRWQQREKKGKQRDDIKERSCQSHKSMLGHVETSDFL